MFNRVELKLTDSKRKFLIKEAISEKYSDKIIEDGRRIYLDHCTLVHNNDFDEDIFNIAKELGQDYKVSLIVLGIGYNDKAMAFKVSIPAYIKCKNNTPHITICTFKGGKPVDSNSITNWEMFDVPKVVMSTINFVYDK